MKKIIALALVGVLWASSAFAYFIQTSKDEFDGTTTVTLDHFFMKSTSPFDPHSLGLSLHQIKGAAETRYILAVDYGNGDKVWLHIPKGESLVFLIDGQRLALSGNGSEGKRFWHKAMGVICQRVL